MKKLTSIGLIILSVLILCSLSYYPIIAEKSINQKSQEEWEFKETNNECGCEKKSIGGIWPFPIICITLYLMIKFVEIFHLWPIGFPPLLVPLYALAGIFNCPWA